MKKTLLFVALIATVAINAGAQLTVYSTGTVGIGTSATDSITIPLAVRSKTEGAISAKSRGRCINGTTTGGGDILACGVFGKASCTSNGLFSGVLGYATYDTPATSGKAFGVRGVAANGANGGNFGVLGVLRGTNNGAGVYGSVDNSSFGGWTDGRYAGYFDGPTKVSGDLIVTGSISGVILGQPSTAIAAVSALSEYNNVRTVADRLSTLSTTCYYFDNPVKAKSVPKLEIPIDADIDSLECIDNSEEEPSEIERLAAERVHYGIDVNTLKESFPELVYEREDGTVAVNYMELIPVLVQAINELKHEVRVLKANAGGSNANNADASSTIINISANGQYIGTKKVNNIK